MRESLRNPRRRSSVVEQRFRNFLCSITANSAKSLGIGATAGGRHRIRHTELLCRPIARLDRLRRAGLTYAWEDLERCPYTVAPILIERRFVMVIPAHQELARWLLAQEMEGRPKAKTPLEGTQSVTAKLSTGITLLVSSDGYRALLGRALYLARAEYSVLDGVRVGTSDFSLEGLRETGTAHEALVSFLAQVIALLARFIGDDLTAKLIRQSWPDAPLGASAPRRRKENA